jgi:DNA-binding NarL/FixJ family response regulator
MEDLADMARKPHQTGAQFRLFLMDDEPAVLRGLQLLLREQPSIAVCGCATHGTEVRAQILALEPDLAVLDLTLQKGDGFELIRQLRQSCPRLKILIFSMHNQISFVKAAFHAGAHGYVSKEDGTEGVLKAVRLLLAGDAYLTPAIAARIPGWRLSLGHSPMPPSA